MSQTDKHEQYADPTSVNDAARRAAQGTTGGTGTGAAMAQEPWDEAKAHLNPFELKLATFIDRRISQKVNVEVATPNGRKAEVLEYLPGGAGLGRLKVQAGSQEPEIVDVDETTFEMLLAKIVNV